MPAYTRHIGKLIHAFTCKQKHLFVRSDYLQYAWKIRWQGFAFACKFIFEVNFKISAVLQSYAKFFKKRRKEYIKKLLRKTSAVRFTFEYPIRFPIIENKVKKGEQQTIIKGVTLRKIKIENDQCFNLKIDGDNARVIFNTFFGRAYVHNVLTLNTDWFEEGFGTPDLIAAKVMLEDLS